MTNKHIVRCSALVFKELQITAMVSYHCTPIKVMEVKSREKNRALRDEKLVSDTLWGNVKWCRLYGEQMRRLLTTNQNNPPTKPPGL